jgi:hypothetical protein
VCDDAREKCTDASRNAAHKVEGGVTVMFAVVCRPATTLPHCESHGVLYSTGRANTGYVLPGTCYLLVISLIHTDDRNLASRDSFSFLSPY